MQISRCVYTSLTTLVYMNCMVKPATYLEVGLKCVCLYQLASVDHSTFHPLGNLDVPPSGVGKGPSPPLSTQVISSANLGRHVP